MKAIKCSNCGFVGFTEEGFCKSCGWSTDLNDQATLLAAAKAEKPRHHFGFKLKLAFGLLALLGIAAGVVVAHSKLTKYFDKTPLYLAAIINADKFKEPVAVRVNRKEIRRAPKQSLSLRPEDKKAGSAVMAADVLEGLGLIIMYVETSVRTVSLGKREQYALFFGSTMVVPPSSKEVFDEVRSENLVIELTEKGRQEATNWKESDEPLNNVNAPANAQPVLPWWIIPIGDREILHIETVTPAPAEWDLETVLITFRWRWRPNKLGESFDLSNPAFGALPEKAQRAVTSLKLTSQSENYGHAKLHKQYGRWECVEITFPSELVKN